MFQNFFWNISGNIFSKGSVFIISIIISRILGIENFGRLGIIQQTTAVFVVFSVLGLSVTSLRFVAKNLSEGKAVVEDTIRKLKLIGTFLSIFMGILFFCFSDYIANEIFDSPDIVNFLKISSFVLVFNSLNQIQFGILSGLGQFKIIARTNVITSFVNIPFTSLLVIYWGLEGVVWALVLNGVLIYLFNHVYINNFTHSLIEKNSAKSVKYKELINFSLPNLLASIVYSWATWYVLTLLTGTSNPLKEIAAYNSINQIFAILYLIPIMLSQVVMSMTASEQKNSLPILKKSVIMTLALVLPFSLFMSLFAEEIMGLYGSDFIPYSNVLIISLMTVVVVGISSQLEHYAVAKGFVWQHLLLNVIFAFSFILLSIYFLDYGVLGIVNARLISYLIRITVVYSILRLTNVKSEKIIPSK